MNILIIKLSAIGDVIHALSVPNFIKQTFPDAKIYWAVEAAAFPLVQACPDVDEAILVPKKEIRSLTGFIKNVPGLRKKLREREYDYSLDLQGLLKSALIANLAGAKKKLGVAKMREFSNLISKSVKGEHKDGHIVEQYLDVAKAMGAKGEVKGFTLKLSEKEQEKAIKTFNEALTNLKTTNAEQQPNPTAGSPEGYALWRGAGAAPLPGLGGAQEVAALIIGGNWPNKRWSGENWGKVAEALWEQGLLPVVFGAGEVDEATRDEILKNVKVPIADLVGKTSLLEAAHLLKNVKIAVGGDTGLTHMAAGMGVPVVMLMGPTNKERNGPFLQEKYAIEVDRDCKGCWKRRCPKGEDCLGAIEADAVIKVILWRL
ncbi:MAG: glycosyltransferase family 9 protein [Selenomonadaceae bacterium]|nr:glycosyltransferase family 9 protein [Selenomonadaceae bacterium]